MKKVRIYALYHDDEFLIAETRHELANYLGVKDRTITFYLSNVHKKRIKQGYIVIFIGVEYE